jgi:hypothetical protein
LEAAVAEAVEARLTGMLALFEQQWFLQCGLCIFGVYRLQG